MLDAYIIDKIRRERESREGERIPLHIEVPRDDAFEPDRDRERRDRDDEHTDRGVVIIDFNV